MYLNSLPHSISCSHWPGSVENAMGQWLPSLPAGQNHLENWLKFMDIWTPLSEILILLVWYGAQGFLYFYQATQETLMLSQTWKCLLQRAQDWVEKNKQLKQSQSPGCTLDLQNLVILHNWNFVPSSHFPQAPAPGNHCSLIVLYCIFEIC